ncbi:efflux RND transporter periplasmic adaptor subunit [Facilibium subflavum]|uniref:efflux RND transporter periplasmic adaptor subunit n=1 Tax=Facilibium subflavum TaxID=2219058 RepID=UPI000E647859|nr:efflux RND transporter periplasmic adaptor subunit [Facilibium subflavum]
MKKHIIFAVVTLILLLVVIYFLFLSSATKPQALKIEPTSVEVAVVDYHNIPITAKATGQLIAPNLVILKSQIAGIVQSINFKSGQYVKEGQLLMRLDDTKQQADVNSALADYTTAKAQFDRTKTLFDENHVVSQSELDTAKADYLQKKAQYDAALYQLSNTKIIAPFSGFLTLTDLSVGSYVSPGDTLVSLVDKRNLEVQYALSESYARDLKIGQEINFHLDAFTDQTFHAKVNYIAPNVSNDNLTFVVRAQFDNKDNLLSPGMSTYVTQVLKQDNKVLAVPEASLNAQSGGFIVYIVNQGKAQAVPVSIGQLYKGYVSILSGVKAGEKVIVSADGSISDGLAVKVES